MSPRKDFWEGPGYRGEYTCPHGIGHGNHVHGCDGCCQRNDFPLQRENRSKKDARKKGCPTRSLNHGKR